MKVWLYSMWTGTLEELEGWIRLDLVDRGGAVGFKCSEKNLVTSRNPGVVYNNTIWFKEKNPIQALESFLEVAEARVSSAKKKLKKHEIEKSVIEQELFLYKASKGAES